MKVRVIVTLTIDDGAGRATPAEISEHCAAACAGWGGQYHPDEVLFSANVTARAVCRGEVADTPA